MLGLPDLTGRAFDPDKPLSFEHCLANLELVSILFGVYSIYQRHASAMAEPMLDDPGMPHVSPDFHVNTIDDLLKEAVPGNVTKGKTTQWIKRGGYNQALEDYRSLFPKSSREIATEYGKGFAGVLQDGTKVNVRFGSSYGTPTLEFQKINGTRIKIRYEG